MKVDKGSLFVHAGLSSNGCYVFVGRGEQRWLAGIKIYPNGRGVSSYVGAVYQCYNCGMFSIPPFHLLCACRSKRY